MSTSNVPWCICLSSQFFYWPIMVLGFAKYSKKFYETQNQYTPKKNCRASISLGVQIGCVFNSVVVSTGWAFAVYHAFNIQAISPVEHIP